VRLLPDQDVYELTARFLRDEGHDVVKVSDIGNASASDGENLKAAVSLSRVFVTRDRDYGTWFSLGKSGLVFCIFECSNREVVHTELSRVLKTYSEAELKTAFVVVEAGRHRFPRI
jgi:predicted nuclease of predicted toxin-antitoxin system